MGLEHVPSILIEEGHCAKMAKIGDATVMKLIVGNAADFQGLGATSKVREPFMAGAGGIQPQEPIHVQVRIRPYADTLPDIRRAHASLNPGRLPVGTILDCYL